MHPEVRRLVDRAIDLTLGAGKVVMYPAATGAEARAMSQRGVRLITMNFGAAGPAGDRGVPGSAPRGGGGR